MAQNTFNPINILDTSEATGVGSGGSLTIGGGASIGKDFFVGGNLSISGTTTNFSDNILLVNKNPSSSVDTGILFQRYTNDITNNQNFSGIIYSEQSDEFQFGYVSNETGRSNATINSFIKIKTNGIDSSSNSNTIGNIITTGGNVGIGTITPKSTLDISGTLNATNSSVGNSNVTNLTAANSNITNSIVINSTVTNLTAANSNVTNLTVGNSNVTNLTAANSNVTNSIVINSNVTNLTGANSSVTNLTAANSNVTNSIVINSNVTNLTGANSTVTNLTAANSNVTNSNITNLTVGNSNVTNLTSANSNVTNSNITNLTVGNSNVTNLTAANSNVTNSNVTTQSVGTVRVTSNLLAIGNSNTIGNIITTGGNVGIGATTPGNNLEVRTATNFGGVTIGGNNNCGVTLSSTNGSLQQSFSMILQKNSSESDRALQFWNRSSITSGAIFTFVNNTNATLITVLNNGNMGIGNGVYPASPLDVRGTTSWGIIRIAPTTTGNECAMGFFPLNDFTTSSQATSGNWIMGTCLNLMGNNNSFALCRNTVPILVASTAANIGIGTTSPSFRLDVNGTANISTSLTTSSVNCLNITTTNVVSTNVSTGSLIGTNTIITNSNITTQTVGTSIVTSNLGIGTVSPSDRLHLATSTTNANIGTVIQNGSRQYRIGIRGDTSNSFTIQDDTAGEFRMIINTSGNVGFGTNSSNSPLDLKGLTNWGTIRLAPSVSGEEAAVGFFSLNDFTTSAQATSGNWLLGTGIPNGGRSNFSLFRSTIPMFVFSTAGNMGIATTTPIARLDTNGAIRSIGVSSVGSGAGIEMQYDGTRGNIYSYDRTNSIYRTLNLNDFVLVTSSGNVAIGGTSPTSAALNVRGAGAGGTIRTYPSTNGQESSIGFYPSQTAGNYWVIGQNSWSAGANLGIGYEGTGLVMIATTSGNVGINVSNPAYALDVGYKGSTVSWSGYMWYDNINGNPATAGVDFIAVNANGSYRCTNGGFLKVSDKRIKKNIQKIENSTEIIKRLNPVTFEYIDKIKNGNSSIYGFIAQEVEAIVPSVVNKNSEDYIPDIYMLCNIENNVITLPKKPDNIDLIGKNIRLIHNNDSNEEIIVEATVINFDLESLKIIIDKHFNNTSRIFVYGTYIKDYHSVSQEGLVPILTSALQEMSSKLEQTQTELEQTKHDLEQTKDLIENLVQRIYNLENKHYYIY